MSAVGKAVKPQLRGLFHDQIRRNLMVAIGLTITAGIIKYIDNVRRKNVYAEYFKNYDIEKEFEDMREKGLFDSCNSLE